MKPRTRILVAVAVVSLIHAGCAYRSEESASNEPTASVEQVADSELGLEKSSVFDTPDPEPANFTAVEPGENPLRGAYFDESPPMISHSIEDMLPIRFGENMCMDCHDMPDMIGDELEPGDPTPIPVSHYTDLRFARHRPGHRRPIHLHPVSRTAGGQRSTGGQHLQSVSRELSRRACPKRCSRDSAEARAEPRPTGR